MCDIADDKTKNNLEETRDLEGFDGGKLEPQASFYVLRDKEIKWSEKEIDKNKFILLPAHDEKSYPSRVLRFRLKKGKKRKILISSHDKKHLYMFPSDYQVHTIQN